MPASAFAPAVSPLKARKAKEKKTLLCGSFASFPKIFHRKKNADHFKSPGASFFS